MQLARWFTDALAFDTETTGVDALNDRIVTAHAVDVGRVGAQVRGAWLFNPGVPIPATATAIHGISDEKAQREGTDPRHELPELAGCLSATWAKGWPVIIMNASFDLTLVQAELQRYGHPQLQLGPVLDPLAIDRAAEPRRRGKRNLQALAEYYQVQQDAAHTAMGDALTAARVVWRQAQRLTGLAHMTLAEMQVYQRDGHAAWAADFETYLRRQGKNDVIGREWPVQTNKEK